MTVKYQSQKIAQYFYTFAVILFLVQVVVGIIAAIQFLNPDIFILNFNTIRTLHINALVVWLLAGLMGATYYVVPEEAETEVWSLPLAKFQFWATVGAIAGIAAYVAFAGAAVLLVLVVAGVIHLRRMTA